MRRRSDTVPVSTWMVSRTDDKVSNSLIAPPNTQATRELQDIFDAKLPHPKSTQLIESLAFLSAFQMTTILFSTFSLALAQAHMRFFPEMQPAGPMRDSSLFSCLKHVHQKVLLRLQDSQPSQILQKKNQRTAIDSDTLAQTLTSDFEYSKSTAPT